MISIVKESCVESYQEAILAYQNHADQLELCSDLSNDGLTPHLDLANRLRAEIDIPIKIMVRCRAGNFVYSDNELRLMQLQIEIFKRNGFDHFVFGCLTENNSIDLKALDAIVGRHSDVIFTFHKAIDEVTDIEEAIKNLKQFQNVKFILSSGMATTAELGMNTLVEMKSLAAPEIEIIAAGKIRSTILEELHGKIGLKYYHGRKIV